MVIAIGTITNKILSTIPCDIFKTTWTLALARDAQVTIMLENSLDRLKAD